MSAISGTGTGEMLDKLVATLPPPSNMEEVDQNDKPLAVAIVGRPNVGEQGWAAVIVGLSGVGRLGFGTFLCMVVPAAVDSAAHLRPELQPIWCLICACGHHMQEQVVDLAVPDAHNSHGSDVNAVGSEAAPLSIGLAVSTRRYTQACRLR